MKGVVYADPSLLVSTLIQDANTERALELVVTSTRVFAITELVELEIRNALELAAYHFPRALEAVERANERFVGMMASGHWRMIEVDFRRSLRETLGPTAFHFIRWVRNQRVGTIDSRCHFLIRFSQQ